MWCRAFGTTFLKFYLVNQRLLQRQTMGGGPSIINVKLTSKTSPLPKQDGLRYGIRNQQLTKNALMFKDFYQKSFF